MAACLATVWIAALISLSLASVAPNIEEYQLDRIDVSPRVEEDVTWPGFPHLGQVSAVGVDGDGNLHVFHRGDRIWDAQTFDLSFRLRDILQGAIPNDTVVVIDPSNGKVLYSWGYNTFFMPHGLTVDRFGNTWLTDVGLHQVFKFPARENKPEMVLGEAFMPGAGKSHLCQPSDVAVTPSGTFFVSDGYCNSRILMFSKNGRLLKEFGSKDGMHVPHSLALVPEHDAVCVADRENGRVLCYATGTDGTTPGTRLASIEGQGLGRVFAIDTRGEIDK
nr:peptidyl-glycine alpha-amidating monooxygenase A [Parasteatoda tepidariorum]